LIAGVWQINIQLGPNANSGTVYLSSTYMTQEAPATIWVTPN
jgi:hypothetical protein